LAARLQGEGAEVVAYDPVAAERAAELLTGVEMADSAEAALEGADAVVLVTEWGEFGELDWSAAASSMARALVVDGRNYLDPEKLRAAGFEYEGIGRAGVAEKTGTPS
jgi:UDPglucose 6-dehydrogenase